MYKKVTLKIGVCFHIQINMYVFTVHVKCDCILKCSVTRSQDKRCLG